MSNVVRWWNGTTYNSYTTWTSFANAFNAASTDADDRVEMLANISHTSQPVVLVLGASTFEGNGFSFVLTSGTYTSGLFDVNGGELRNFSVSINTSCNLNTTGTAYLLQTSGWGTITNIVVEISSGGTIDVMSASNCALFFPQSWGNASNASTINRCAGILTSLTGPTRESVFGYNILNSTFNDCYVAGSLSAATGVEQNGENDLDGVFTSGWVTATTVTFNRCFVMLTGTPGVGGDQSVFGDAVQNATLNFNSCFIASTDAANSNQSRTFIRNAASGATINFTDCYNSAVSGANPGFIKYIGLSNSNAAVTWTRCWTTGNYIYPVSRTIVDELFSETYTDVHAATTAVDDTPAYVTVSGINRGDLTAIDDATLTAAGTGWDAAWIPSRADGGSTYHLLKGFTRKETWTGYYEHSDFPRLKSYQSPTLQYTQTLTNGVLYSTRWPTTDFSTNNLTGAPSLRNGDLASTDGDSWTNLTNATSGEIHGAIVVDASNIYAFGAFSATGDLDTAGLDYYDGTDWTTSIGSFSSGEIISMAHDSTNNRVYILTSANVLQYSTVGGSTWTTVSGVPDDISSMFCYNGSLLVGAAYTVHRFDGTSTWSNLGNDGETPAKITNASAKIRAFALDSTNSHIYFCSGLYIFKSDPSSSWVVTTYSSAANNGLTEILDLVVDTVSETLTVWCCGFGSTGTDFVATYASSTWTDIGSSVLDDSDGIIGLERDSEGNLWATPNSEGFFVYDGTTWYTSISAAETGGMTFPGGGGGGGGGDPHIFPKHGRTVTVSSRYPLKLLEGGPIHLADRMPLRLFGTTRYLDASELTEVQTVDAITQELKPILEDATALGCATQISYFKHLVMECQIEGEWQYLGWIDLDTFRGELNQDLTHLLRVSEGVPKSGLRRIGPRSPLTTTLKQLNLFFPEHRLRIQLKTDLRMDQRHEMYVESDLDAGVWRGLFYRVDESDAVCRESRVVQAAHLLLSSST